MSKKPPPLAGVFLYAIVDYFTMVHSITHFVETGLQLLNSSLMHVSFRKKKIMKKNLMFKC